MHWVPLAIAVAAAGPTETSVELDASRGGDAIGVVWHDQATVAPTIQQRLASSLAAESGDGRRPPVIDAFATAAARITLEIPRDRLDQGTEWRRSLAEVDTAYRAGELELGQQRLMDLLQQIRADPVVPGAASLAWRAQVLRGQLAWAQGDEAQLDAALAAAVALDPQARPSTRTVPPPVVEAYQRQQQRIVDMMDRWSVPRVVEPDGQPFVLEIDGVPGQRPVPPGEHLVVVRRPGRAAVGTVMDAAAVWELPADEVLLSPGLPVTASAAERICQSAQLGWLVLARQRDGRLGLQRYSCGEGFGPAWYEGFEGPEAGAGVMVATPDEGWTAEPVLHLDDPWPQMVVPEPPAPLWMMESSSTPPSRRRLRRALPWLLISGVIAGAVTVGVVVAGDVGPDLSVDGNSFLRPR